MLGKLLLLFTVVPVVELYLLITIGGLMGAGPTIALVLGTGFMGAWLARREGSRVLRGWQESLVRGEIPKEGMTSSLLVLVGGVFLVTPGVLTDVAGILLLVPWTRRWVAAVIRRQLEHRFAAQAGPLGGLGMDGVLGRSDLFAGAPQGTVIDVDVVDAPPPTADGSRPA